MQFLSSIQWCTEWGFLVDNQNLKKSLKKDLCDEENRSGELKRSFNIILSVSLRFDLSNSETWEIDVIRLIYLIFPSIQYSIQLYS